MATALDSERTLGQTGNQYQGRHLSRVGRFEDALWIDTALLDAPVATSKSLVDSRSLRQDLAAVVDEL